MTGSETWYDQVTKRAKALPLEEQRRLIERAQEGRRTAIQVQAKGGRSTVKERRAIAAGERAEADYIEANFKLVLRVAMKMHRSVQGHMELDDLIQEGSMGLLHALRKFDWSRGTRFSTYAIPWIRQYIGRAISNQGRTIRLPVHIAEEVRKITRTRDALDVKLGRAATDEEVATAAGITVDRVRQLSVHTTPILPLGLYGDDNRDVADRAASSVEEKVIAKLDAAAMNDALEDTLTPDEIPLISLRYRDELTRDDTADWLHIRTKDVRRLETAALQKLRLAMAA